MNKKEKEILKKSSVTYDVAFALRQKGFNEPCLGYYMQGHDFCYFSPPDYTYKDTTLTKWCIAPLWQQVIDWFMNQHGIYIEVAKTRFKDDKFRVEIKKYNVNERLCSACKYDTFKGLENAREQAILKAIKLI